MSKQYYLYRRLTGAVVLITMVLLSACGQPATTSSLATATPAALTAIVAASELVVGQNRLPLGVVKDGTPINDPDLKVHVRFYALDDAGKATAQGETDAPYRGQGLPFGLYVAYPTLDKAGAWGLEVQMTEVGQQPQVSRLRVEVLEQSTTPAVGSNAIPSDNQTVNDVPDLTQLTSDGTPDADLYQLTIADALAAQQPFLVAFSTPGFCQTAVCSPNLKVIKQLKDQFKGTVNFIHVEVYQYPFSESAQQVKFVSAMTEWGLQTEPWTFLVDAQGVIQAKYEGGVTFVELEPALQQLAAGQPIVSAAEAATP